MGVEREKEVGREKGEREEESGGERYGVGGGERGRKELRHREIEVERERE